MNAKLISAVLGTLALSAPMMARADDAAAPAPAPVKETTAKMKKADKKAEKKADKDAKAAKGGEKSCGADGKSCGGK